VGIKGIDTATNTYTESEPKYMMLLLIIQCHFFFFFVSIL